MGDVIDLVVYRYSMGDKYPLETLKISSKDRWLVAGLTWFKDPGTHRVFATRNGKRVFLKEILKKEGGTWIHANGDPLDYTRTNLIKSDTNVRTIKRTRGSSKYVGVCYVPGRKKPWKATLSGKLLGYFETEDEASLERIKIINSKHPMVQFVPARVPFEHEMDEGVQGPSDMYAPPQTAGGVPDTYTDLDDIDVRRPDFAPFTMGYDLTRVSTFVKIPPPPETNPRPPVVAPLLPSGETKSLCS